MEHTYIHKIIGIPFLKKTVGFDNGFGHSKYYIFNILVYEKYFAD